jgi:hypothetical protein
MTMHSLLPPHFYGAMGYKVFSFLFNWTDEKWEKDLRDRMFQFAPVYVSAESMRWWLGRECFAKQKCILATREEKMIEDREDEQEDREQQAQSLPECDSDSDSEENQNAPSPSKPSISKHAIPTKSQAQNSVDKSRYSWYAPGTPPFAFWVCGSDDLVDGRRLLRRFERGREPHVDVVHAKVIEGYEHLDVIWAMDAIEKVGKEVREVIWKTADTKDRSVCRTPRGCEGIHEDEFYVKGKQEGGERRMLDASAGEWSQRGGEQVGGGGGEGRRDLEAEIESVREVVA